MNVSQAPANGTQTHRAHDLNTRHKPIAYDWQQKGGVDRKHGLRSVQNNRPQRVKPWSCKANNHEPWPARTCQVVQYNMPDDSQRNNMITCNVLVR